MIFESLILVDALGDEETDRDRDGELLAETHLVEVREAKDELADAE